MTHLLTGDDPTLAAGGAVRGPGALDALDPRLRVIAACVFGVTVACLSSLLALGCALAAAGAMLALSRLPPGRTLRRMAMMDGFILFLLLLLPLTTPGTPMFAIWGMAASHEGLLHAIRIALTANATILALMVLAGSMQPVALGHALHALRCPEALVHLLLFTVRYAQVLRDEHLRLQDAMKLRGFRPGTNRHTYRAYGHLAGMMLVRSVERSERIMEAMKCRGFTGRMPLLHSFAFTRADAAFAAGFAALLAALIAVELSHAAH